MKINDFFNLENTNHKDIWQGLEYPWEVIPKIESFINGEKRIDETAKIEEGAIIKGPCIIGKNVEIRSGAYIRGNVIIGDNCVIGNSSELKNCFLFNNVQVPHFNYVGDSVLGYKAHLGAGAIISNLKISSSEIVVKTVEREYKTGLSKFGAIIGDNTEIGCNAVINPGSVIGQNCLIYPLTSFRGVLGNNLILKSRQQQDISIKR